MAPSRARHYLGGVSSQDRASRFPGALDHEFTRRDRMVENMQRDRQDDPRNSVWVRFGALTEVGRTRKENQDAFMVSELVARGDAVGLFLVSPTPVVPDPFQGPHGSPGSQGDRDPVFRLGTRGALLAVADGMGGPAGGARASGLALAAVSRSIERSWQPGSRAEPEAFGAALLNAVAEANRKIHEESRAEPALRGMGTTLTLAGILSGTLHIVQVGDSRGYIYRGGSLVQVTRDQSMVQELIDAGVITEEEARVSPQRNVILKALGTEPQVESVITSVELGRGDLVLLCSDGLAGVLTSAEITAILNAPGSLTRRCRALVDAANDAGGPDNITAVLAEVDGEPLPVEVGAGAPPSE
ncbi:MAG: serine/threonine-protein phosphatase [Gemmatimonadales bacterium]|nr:MAG: serine/threonine-protein phosphatase [Gemmatimonadales bacterium]